MTHFSVAFLHVAKVSDRLLVGSSICIVLFTHGCGSKSSLGVSAGSSGGSSGSDGSATSNALSTANPSGGSAGSDGSVVSNDVSITRPSGGSAGSGASVNAGSGGSASDANDGFDCPYANHSGGMHCAPGQTCIFCVIADLVTYRCAPGQARDPEGFARGTVDCSGVVAVGECDGPEDCLEDGYCISDGVTRCARELTFGSCCPACPTTPPCTLCRVDDDCGEAGVCEENSYFDEAMGTCAPKPCGDDNQCPSGYACRFGQCTPVR